MEEFITADDATVYFTPRDVNDFLRHGDVLWAKRVANLDLRQQRRLRRQWWWPRISRNFRSPKGLADLNNQEQLAADLLEWGRGLVHCQACDARYAAAQLLCLERRGDGLDQRWFYCPKSHLVLDTYKGCMGAIDTLGHPLPLPDAPFGRYLYPAKRTPNKW